jgi:hypothetical protein
MTTQAWVMSTEIFPNTKNRCQISLRSEQMGLEFERGAQKLPKREGLCINMTATGYINYINFGI